MTEFGSLYYTDCRPGQGLQRTAGFQFQAASPGVAAEAMSLVAQTALYEPPRLWMREQRAVADYPESLAHVVEGRLLVTAAGRYLGKEANGTREGNQFTHAIVTHEDADYGLIRPAQLWAAPWWARGPASGTELDAVPAHPEPGVLDTETVRGRVRTCPDGKECLTALLSAVQRQGDAATRRTIVLVSVDPEEAACWIAAATLLMPARDALRTTFKIFVADASYSSHDIIGVHPEWAGRWGDVGPDTGLAVFDLDRRRHTSIDPTEDAAFWVPLFLHRADPFDVVDAVELAGQLAGERDTEGVVTSADRLVALVVAAGEPLVGAAQVQMAADWLRTAPESAVKMAREGVIDAVLDARPGSTVLRTLADAAGSRGWNVLPTIHRGLLRAELDDLLAERDGVAALGTLQGYAPLVHMGPPAPDEDRDAVEAALLRAGPDQVPALLTLARRHKIAVRPEAFGTQGHAFASWWLQNPEPSLMPDRWSAPPYAVQWARDRLRASLATGGEGAQLAIGIVEHRWWRPLWKDASSVRDPLDRHLISTAYRHLDTAARAVLVGATLRLAANDPAPGVAPDTLAWQVLFGGVMPTLDEVRGFTDEIDLLGLSMSFEVADQVCAVLDRAPEGSAVALGVVRRIQAAGHRLSERQRRRLETESSVLSIAHDLRAEKEPPTESRISVRLAKVPPEVLERHASLVVDALVQTRYWRRAIAAVCDSPQRVLTPIYNELRTRWPEPGKAVTDAAAEAVAFSFLMLSAEPGEDKQRRDFTSLRHLLGVVVGGLSKEDRARIHSVGELDEAWWTWVAEVEPRRLRIPRLGRSGKHATKDS